MLAQPVRKRSKRDQVGHTQELMTCVCTRKLWKSALSVCGASQNVASHPVE